MGSPSARRTPLPPTLSSVAELAGVSRQTVSNALNNPELLRADTLARVREVIAEVGYTPNRAARQLRTRSSHLVGLRFEQAQEGTTNALMDRFLHTLVETTREAGLHVLLFSGDPDDPLDGYESLLRSTAVDAFVVTDTYQGTPQAAWLGAQGAPFVAFGRPWGDPQASYPWVDVDGAAGTALATEHLLEQGFGRVAWIGWEAESRIGEDRRSGWQAVMTRAGIDTTGLGVRITDNVDAARMATHELLDAGGVDAVACASDTQAMGVLHALAERGLTPGRDIGVVGFDDSSAAQVTPPGLTSVRQPLEDVAVQLIGRLQLLLLHRPIEDPGLVLPPSLVVRRSSTRS